MTDDISVEARNIIDDIEAGLVDDPAEDYKYLMGEVKKLQGHELFEEVLKGLVHKLYVTIPTEIRKGLKDDFSGGQEAFDNFDAMIIEAGEYLQAGHWQFGATILSNLIGDGIHLYDTDDTECRALENEVQYLLYNKFFKEKENVVGTPVDLATLYGLYGCALMELEHPDEARKMLEISLHYNPMNLGFFFEFAETFKIKGEIDQFEKMTREYLQYAYTSADIGRLYRNLGYSYVEKKDFKTATALLLYSLVYDPKEEQVDHELEYIAQVSGREIEKPSEEELKAVFERENIQLGASDLVVQVLYNSAYYESAFNHDLKRTEYFCKFILDITGNEDLVKELVDAASSGSGAEVIAPSSEEPSIYDVYKERFLKKIFPDYPEVTKCGMRINFTINSTKYEATILQILTHFDDISKVVTGKDVALYFADIKTILENIYYINDIHCIANSWKSFEIKINDIDVDNDCFRYFKTFLRERYGIREPLMQKPDDLRRAYKKEAGPATAKKENPEEDVKLDLTGCTPQQIVKGLAMTYAKIYLKDCDVKSYVVSDDEIVLCANDDFVVDFWVSPYNYGDTFNGTKGEYAPYEYCCYFVQELTRNNLFKYNASAFKRCLTGQKIYLDSLVFKGRNYYRPEIDRIEKVNSAIPELRLQEKIDAWPGINYCFVIFEMDNADGSIGRGIGVTDKDEQTLAKKVCKNLEACAAQYIEGRGVNGLDFYQSGSFFTAFASWKGMKKAERLEKYLRYYSFEVTLKNEGAKYNVEKGLLEQAATGKHDEIEKKTYADIGRRTKKK